MRFVTPPTWVGDLRWPVLSAVRVSTVDEPAEFVVVVDCGEGTPREPFATLRVFVWRDHTKAEQGEYDLTFAEAQRRLADRAGLLPTARTRVEVVVVRDPDEANDYAVFIDGVHRPEGITKTVQVVTHGIDLGATETTPAWVDDQLRSADNTLSPAAAQHAREAIAAYADDLDTATVYRVDPGYDCGEVER
jgi:hypothetical protein